MDENSLCSLTHTTPNTHTCPNSSHATTNDDDGDLGDGDHGVASATPAENVTADSSPADEVSIEERIRNEFNISKFMTLAMRVVDKGDSESMAALLDLNRWWTEKFGAASITNGAGVVSTAGFDSPPVRPLPTSPPRIAASLLQPTVCFASPTATLPVVSTSPPPTVLNSTPTRLPLEFAAPTASPAGGNGLPGLTSPPVVAAAPNSALYIGNVPLTPCLNSFSLGDKITEAYHKSSRKTLSFVPPSVQNGEVIVRLSIDIIRHGSSSWKTTAVGYFLGKRLYFDHLNDYVCSIWPGIREVTATVTGFYFFQFKMEAAMEEVIEGGPWLFQGQPIVIQKWEPGVALRKLKHTQVPVWIKLRHLPVELWTPDGLSTVASGIGKTLYPDAIRRACTRLDFARVCVMLDISSKLPRHVIIVVPLENRKPRAEPFKSTIPADPINEHVVDPAPADTAQRGGVSVEPVMTSTVKGKEIIIFNPFEILQSHDDVAESSSRDPISSPSTGLHYRMLHVCSLPYCLGGNGLLIINNPGNRIWLAWNDEFIDVDVVDIGVQFIHCRILIRSMHISVLVTITYGDNEIRARRDLWQALCNIADSTGQEPWLVGGDLNAVRDMSEVCGTSGDIRQTMHEFNECILRTGLIVLPMRGVQFSWHNCSTDGRSPWKRLDRMLVNDMWLERWPDAHYECLKPRTSNHSPLLLRGDVRDAHVSMFRFDNFLALSPGFIASVQNVWRHRIIGTPMYSVTRKLKALKPVLRQQRKRRGISH
ncbi:hypothetical protein Sango_3078400 [Sesamum angolense]|uniref:DUF4283 domain-containing protein n=1 Tax=Sesamum angolense TaxID=2727404 RepID=A0AAE1TB33_9LAMI|nr:hypothetical protein Sango_3078400 [Sesamum angolense]